MNKGINLLRPEERLTVKPASLRLGFLRVIALSLLFGVSSISIVLFLLIALSPLPTLQNQEQSALNAISKFHPDIAKLFIVDDRLKSSQTILTQRKRFDVSLNKILEKMPGSVSVTAVSMNKDKVSVTVSSQSLASIKSFIDNLVSAADTKKDFSKVTLTNFLTDETHNSYIVSIDVVSL